MRRSILHAAKARVRQARVRRSFHPRAGTIARAIKIAAKIRAAPRDALSEARFVWIETIRWAARIFAGTCSNNQADTSPRTIPIRFPHVIQTEFVCGYIATGDVTRNHPAPDFLWKLPCQMLACHFPSGTLFFPHEKGSRSKPRARRIPTPLL